MNLPSQPAREAPLWRSYVPLPVAVELLEAPLASLLGRERRFEGVALFADIAGFTPLSEALGETGRRGTEELTELVNGFFERMIAMIESFGGAPWKFGGDAITAVFPLVRGRRAVARRALTCALNLQASMRSYRRITTSAGEFRLAIRVGLGMGEVVSVLAGDPEIRAEYVLAGRVLDVAAQAQGYAAPGEVVAHEEVVRAAGDVGTTPRRGAFSHIQELRSPARRAPLKPPDVLDDGRLADAVEPFLHPSLIARLRSGQGRFVNEHRRVTVLFGRFPELQGPADDGTRLHRYAVELVRVIAEHGGHLRQLHMGDKGNVYIAVFGAPIAHERYDESAVRCALDLRELNGTPSAIGINSGRVFCGFVGSRDRQEYAVIGVSVILAGRLMQRSRPGEILVGPATRETVATVFAWDEVGAVELKGISGPVDVWRLKDQHRAQSNAGEPLARGRFLGRKAELATAETAVRRAATGEGLLLGITGEPGIGKSRFVAEVARSAAELRFSTLFGASQALGARRTYHPWTSVWRELLGVRSSDSREEQVRSLRARLAAVGPRAVRQAPMLGAVLDLHLEETELTRDLVAEVRSEAAHSLLLSLLQGHSRHQPLLLVLEDCHWIDPASLELLTFLGRNLRHEAVLLLVTYRPSASCREPLGRLARFEEIELGSMSAAEVSDLVEGTAALLGAADELDATTRARIAATAGGNPFYVEELVRYLVARGIEQGLPEELPESLESVVNARIDQLDEPAKATLRVASVVGRRFRARWVAGGYPALGSARRVRSNLDELSRLELTPLQRSRPELEYMFKHSVTQQVAYDAMSFSLREEVHEGIADFVESAYSRADDHLEALAYHFGRSRNVDKQRVYFRRAGEAAERKYANDAAVDHYTKLVGLLPGSERSAWTCRLAEVFQLMGRWQEAEKAFRDALALAEEHGAEREIARAEAGTGSLLSQRGLHEAAIGSLDSARSRLEQLEEPAELRRVLEHLSYAHFWRSDFDTALEVADTHLRLAASLNDQVGLGRAAETLGLVQWRRGDTDQAVRWLEQALGIARKEKHAALLIDAANDLAGVLEERGRYAAASARLQEALTTATEIGYRRAVGVLVANDGRLSLQQGEWARAQRCYWHALRTASELGRLTGVVNALDGLAVSSAELGFAVEADALFDGAISLARASGDARFLSRCLYDRAAMLARWGRPDEALATCTEAGRLAGSVSSREVVFNAELLAALLDRDAAELTRLLETSTDDAERAHVLYTFWKLDPRREEARKEAAALYRRLQSETPNIEFRRRYGELTGKTLGQAPSLPPLPTDVALVPDPDELFREALELAGQPEA